MAEKQALVLLREGPIKITKTVVETAWRRRAKNQRIVIGDASCRGLALVVNPTGMTWRFDYKPRGTDPTTGKRFPTRSITIGNPESHSPDAARDAAGAIKGQAKAGADPAQAKRAALLAQAAKRARTLDRLVEDYATALPLRPKMRGDGTLTGRHVHYELAHIKAGILVMNAGGTAVADIGATEIRAMLTASAAKQATAKHRFGALSRFFDWCQDEGFIALNPCSLVAKARRPRPVAARQHHMTMPELASMWHAIGEAEGLGTVHRDLLRFLIAVPSRRGEAASMDWAHVDLTSGIWTQRQKRTKNGDAHRLPLPKLALDILRARHSAANRPVAGLVFPGPKSGKELATFSRMRKAISTKFPGEWRLHDLRRSFATALGEAGEAEAIADAMLNHRQSATRGGVMGIYQRAQRWPEQVQVMEAWGAILEAAIDGKPAGEPVADVAAARTTARLGRVML